MARDWKTALTFEIDRSGRSMRSVSLQAGLSPNYLRMVLRCGRTPGIDNLMAIARALDVPLSNLLPDHNAGLHHAAPSATAAP